MTSTLEDIMGTGKFEPTYLTPEGNRYRNKAVADEETRQYRQTADMSAGGQLRNAYKRLAEVEEQLGKRGEELVLAHKENHPTGFFGRLSQAAKEASTNAAAVGSGIVQDAYNPEEWSEFQNDRDYQALRLTRRKLKEEIQKLSNAKQKDEKGERFWHDFGRNTFQAVADTDAWDFGKNAARDAQTILNMANKNNDELSDAERNAMYELYLGDNVMNEFGDLGRGARWGDIAGGSISFMKDFLLTGGGFEALGGGLSSKIASKIATKTAARLGTEAAESIGKRVAEKGLFKVVGEGGKGIAKKLIAEQGIGGTAGLLVTKALGVTAEDLLIRAPLLTGTLQGADTLSEIVETKLGPVKYNPASGDFHFSDEKGWGEAAWQVGADKVIENFSEMWGAHLPGMADVTKTFGARNLTAMILRSTREGAGTVLSKTVNFLSKAGVNGYFGEVGEEYYGQLWRSVLNLDSAYTQDSEGNRINNLKSGQFHGDIWGGMALSIGLTGGVSMGTQYAVRGAADGATYIRHKHNVSKASSRASEIIGRDKWEEIRTIIDATSNNDIGNLAASIVNDNQLSDEQTAATMDYMTSLMVLRGSNLREYVDSRNGQGASPEADDASQSYIDGYYSTSAQERTDAKNLRDYYHEQLAEAAGEQAADMIDSNPGAAVETLRENRMEWASEIIGLAFDYLNAKQVYDGMIQRVRDDINGRVEQSNAMISARTNKTTGKIQPVSLKLGGRKVYVIAGNIVPYKDGTGVDINASDGSIAVRDMESGKLEIIDPNAVLSIDEAEDAAELQQNAADEIRRSEAEKAVNEIDGKVVFQPGQQVVFTDDNGLDHTYTVITDNGGDTITVTSDGTTPQELSRDYFQAKADASSMQRVKDFENSRAEANGDNTSAEAETSPIASAPVEARYERENNVTLHDENGNPVGAQIISDVNEDGQYEVALDSPINGKRILLLNSNEIDQMRGSENETEAAVEETPVNEDEENQVRFLDPRTMTDQENGSTVADVIAGDYLLTGGRGVIMSSGYFFKALGGVFPKAAKAINAVFSRHPGLLYGNLADMSAFMASENFGSVMDEVNTAIADAYGDLGAHHAFDFILKHGVNGLTINDGRKVSAIMDSVESGVRVDNQGNSIDEQGKLITEAVSSVDDITDEDFISPTRSVILPTIPENVSTAIGAKEKPVVIKKSVFIKNASTHSDIDPASSRDILNRALFNPNLVGSKHPISRPDYKVVIQTGDKNAVVVLDVFNGKDNVEIVGWRRIDEKGLRKMERQAEREGGQILILSPNEGSAAALSALPNGVSSDAKDSESISQNNGSESKKGENRAAESTPIGQTSSAEDIQTQREAAPVESVPEDTTEATAAATTGEISLAETPDVVDDTPEAARKRGFRRVSGNKVDRQEPISRLEGKSVSVKFSNKVIQGNNRADALRYMWNSAREQGAVYKQYLMDHADKFGLNPDEISAMESPVLVNMFDVDDNKAIELGQYVAQDTESGGLERIKPKNAVQRMGDDMKTFAEHLLDTQDDDASFSQLVDLNGDAVLRWMNKKGYITSTQFASAYDSKGNITAEAKNDLKGIMFQSIFRGANRQLEEMFERMPAKAQKAILATAFRDFNSPVSESMIVEIQDSIKAFDELMRDPEFAVAKNWKDVMNTVESWKNQLALDDVTGDSYLPAEKYSNFALHLAAMYKADTQKKIQATFNEIYDLVQGMKEDNLFEVADKTPRTLVQAIKEVLNIDYDGQRNSTVLGNKSQNGEERRPGLTGDNQSGERETSGERPANDSRGTEGGSRDGGETQQNQVSEENQVRILDPRTMTDQEKQLRGEMLRNAAVTEVSVNVITSTPEMSARKAAEKWWDENVSEPAFYNTEVGEVEINRTSIESSLAHRYGQKKLDVITSLIEGFENAVYLGSMPGSNRQEGVFDHYFSFPISYNGELNYVFCRAMQDANKNRLYVHEVFLADNIIKGDTLQTAAFQPHGGISLYRDILANVLDSEFSSQPTTQAAGLSAPQRGSSDAKDSESISQNNDSESKKGENSAELDENGRILLHKTFFTQKKEPYARETDIRSEDVSREGGVSSISPAEAAALNLESRRDGNISADKGTDSSGVSQDINVKHSYLGATSSVEEVEAQRAAMNTAPSEAQKLAGNYAKGHVKVDGYNITIENPKGSTRSGKDANGKAWSVKMNYDYGYIRGTKTVDGDHIDIYLSDNPTNGNVYVVDQVNQNDGSFDEHKVMYGFPSAEAAREAYASQYEAGWKVGTVTEVSREDFKKWVESSKRKTKPFSEYKIALYNEPRPIGNGIFGNIYDQFKGKVRKAFAFLLDHKEGDLLGVFHRPEVGDIDLVWGDVNGGLAHIISKHIGKGSKDFTNIEELQAALEDTIANGVISFENGDKVVFEKDNKLVTIRKTLREKGKKTADKNWVLTAYDKKPADGASVISDTNETQATRGTGLSGSKGRNNSSSVQEKEKKSSESFKAEKVGDKTINPKTGKPYTLDELREMMDSGDKDAMKRAEEAWSAGMKKGGPKPEADRDNPNGYKSHRAMDDAYRSGDAQAIKDSEKQMREFLDGVDDERIIRNTIDAAKRHNKKLGKDDPVRKSNESKLKMLKKRLKEVQTASSSEDKPSAKKWIEERVKPLEKAGLKFVVIGSLDEIEDKSTRNAVSAALKRETVYGWTDKKNGVGYVYIYAPSYVGKQGERELERTILHEAVQHYGVKELLGESGFTTAMNDIWRNSMDALAQKKFAKYVWDTNYNSKKRESFFEGAGNVDWDHLTPEQKSALMKNAGFTADAADEWAANMIETTDVEKVPWFRKLTNLIREALRKLGLHLDFDEADLRKAWADVYRTARSGQAIQTLTESDAVFRRRIKESANDTGSGSESHHSPVVSFADGANIRKNLQNLANDYEKRGIKRPHTFVGDVAKALEMRASGRISQYGTYEAKNGDVITIRLSDHNSKVSNWDDAGVDDGISIVVSSKPNQNLTNDGEGHIVEVYYDAKKLGKAKGNPLADIARSLEQTMYSGKYEDTTGLAEIDEANPHFRATPAERDAMFRVEYIPEIESVAADNDSKVDAVNRKFNEDLQKQIDGTLPSDYIYQLGMPGTTLLRTGAPNQPIELKASQLKKKSVDPYHPFDISNIKDLVKAINEPIAVFSYGNNNDAQNVIVELEDNGKKFNVGIHFNLNYRGITVNDIRGLFNKGSHEWLNWINQGKLLSVDKKKIQDLIDKQRTNLAEVDYLDLDSVAKVVKVFKNPTLESRNESAKKDSDLRFRAEQKEKRDAQNKVVAEAISFMTGKSIKEAKSHIDSWLREHTDLAKEIYKKVLDGNFNDVTLRQIDKYIDEYTPGNPFGRHISQRIPQKVERSLRAHQRANSVDALISRIAESTISTSGKSLSERTREIREVKHNLLEGWAKASGLWYENVNEIPEIGEDREAIGRGTDSTVYMSTDNNSVIKLSRGKDGKYVSDIDAANLFNGIFWNTSYNIIGYGRIDGNFVTILKQPAVVIGENFALSDKERVDYMHSLGFEPRRNLDTVFSNGELVVADLQKSNIVRDVDGNIRVIDADVRLHTKDIGGNYTYPDPSVETGARFRVIGEKDADLDIDNVNDAFNKTLAEFNEANADKTVFDLGRPSEKLLSAGVSDMPMKLYGSKVMKKVRKHGFDPSELRNLPKAVANPIAVFNNYGSESNRSILTEITTKDGNYLVTIEWGKGQDVDFNIVSSVFGKSGNSIVNWVNNGHLTYVDKEKALKYLHLSAPITEASSSQELSSAVKVVREFDNSKAESGEFKHSAENDTDLQGANSNLRFRVSPEQDAEYLDAVNSGDMEKAQRMVKEAADAAGYSLDSDYQGTSAFNGSAPVDMGYYDSKVARVEALRNDEFEGDVTLGDMLDASEGFISGGIVPFLERQTKLGRDMAKESARNLLDAIKSGKKTVKMYRSVPADIKEGSFRNGDWITPSRAYAEDNADVHGFKGNIIEQEVSVDDIWWDGNDVNEWGYDDGKGYVYSNTKNNRKLLNPVTYDNEGNVIPLSQRFNSGSGDVRFRFIGEKDAANADKAEETTTRLDNLAVARDMETAGKSGLRYRDGEEDDRLKKLRNSESARITGDEIEPSDDIKQYKKNALEYGKKMQGTYTNKDTGMDVQLQRGRKNGGINEVLQHDYKDVEHLQSIAAIPQIIENGIFIASEENQDKTKNPNVKEYQHYVCGLRIGSEDYTVRSVYAVDKDGNRYYDHKLTHVEKAKLLDLIDQATLENSFGTMPGTKPTTDFGYKDKRLVSLLRGITEKSATEATNTTDLQGADSNLRFRAEQALSTVEQQKTPDLVSRMSEEDDVDFADVRFRVGNKRRAEMENILAKKRPDITEEQRGAFFDYMDVLDNTKAEAAVFNWFKNGRIAIPEDNYKIEAALEVLRKNPGIDPMRYKSPMDLLDEFSKPEQEDEVFDPTTKAYLSNGRKVADVTVYDMEDNPEAAKDFCETVMQKFYETSPWCLMAWGNHNEWVGEQMWNHYNLVGRAVAFNEDGKPVAFMSSDNENRTWWDETDKPHEGVPVSLPIEGDKFGRMGIYDINETTGERAGMPTAIFKGSKKDGVYEEWHISKPDVQKLQQERKHHKLNGESIMWDHSGALVEKKHYKDGKLNGIAEFYWHGGLSSRTNYKDDVYDGVMESYHDNGRLSRLAYYKDGIADGAVKTWHPNGQIQAEGTYKNGKRLGIVTTYHENGQMESIENINENGKFEGYQGKWDDQGNVKKQLYYTTQGDGVREIYYPSGQIKLREHTQDGWRMGRYQEWDENGNVMRDTIFEYGLSKMDTPAGYPEDSVDDYLNGNVEATEGLDSNVRFRIREKEAPEKTGTGYKVFVLKDGRLYPPMVANPNGEATPVGVWLDADAAPVAGASKTGRPQVKAGGKGTQGGSGKLAYRPGWHLGEIPYAKQFNRVNPETGERELFPADFVWAEVEYAADNNYQSEAEKEGMNENGKFVHSLAGLKKLPTDGFYKYRTNPDPMTDPWIITGAMKVNRILTPTEVDDIVRAAGREPQTRQNGAVTDEQIKSLNEGIHEGVRFRFSRSREEFERTQKDAVAGTGLVTPGLNDASVEVVRVPRHTFVGEKPIKQAETWAKENIVGEHILDNGDNYSISNSAVEKYLSQSAVAKSENLRVQLSVLRMLPEVINASIDAEVHPDYKKGADGVRRAENGVDNKDMLVHRMYGAVEIDGQTYRVKTTMHEYISGKKGVKNAPHSYEVTKIEVLEKMNTSDGIQGHANIGFTLGTANLLKGIEKSYDSGKKLLDESQTVTDHARMGAANNGRTDTAVAKRRRVEELAKKLNLGNVLIEENLDNLQGKRRHAKGFYTQSTGKITIVLSNNTDVADIEQTLLHEAVAHYGLRRLFGKDFENFLDNVFNNAAVQVRKKIVALAAKNGWDFQKATEEYLAGLAENTNFENAQEEGWWNKIKKMFLDLLDRLGFKGLNIGFRLRDNELRYILWRSYDSLKGGKYSNLFKEAEDITMQMDLKVGEFEKNDTDPEGPDTNPDGTNRRSRFSRNMKSGLRALQRLAKGEDEVRGAMHRMELEKLGGTSEITFIFGKPGAAEKGYKGGYGISHIGAKHGGGSLIKVLSAVADGDIIRSIEGNKTVVMEKDGYEAVLALTKNGVRKTWLLSGWEKIENTGENGKVSANHVSTQANPTFSRTDLGAVLSDTNIAHFFDNARNNATAPEGPDTNPDGTNENTKFNETEREKETILFRDGEDYSRALARHQYEQRVRSGMYQMREALQDSMLGLKEAMSAILRNNTDIKDVAGFENAYLGENRLSSVNKAEADAFAHLVFKPLLNEIANLAHNETERGDLIDYMMAKHGLERNRVMAERDAARAEDKSFDDALEEFRKRDYAGLTALTSRDDVAEAENEAQEMVDDYERGHNTATLWEKVKAVNTAILSKSLECGMISRATYDHISSMYQYYIPLRGFEQATSEDVYAYLRDSHSTFAAPIKAAHGRKSKADDPLANLQTMAETAIMQGNRNKLVKQKFLNFMLNHPSDLASVNELWLKKDDVTGDWVAAFPDNLTEADTPEEVESKMREFGERMEELAKQQPDKYKKGKDAANIPYRVLGKQELRQHQVIVKRNGKDYVITINGNPRAAQALNGLTNPDNDMNGAIGKILNGAHKVNRQLSAFYTTRNPDFVLSNFIRDMLYSNSMTWIKESPNYALRFHRNYLLANPVRMKQLLKKFRTGALDMNNRTEAMFQQFMMNGGETGYSNIRDIEQHKNEIRRELKKANGKLKTARAWELLTGTLDEFNRAVENCARFAAFLTSRDMGRSIERAIYDAKEISVNFNKKGSGAKFLDSAGQSKTGNAAAFVSGIGRSGFVFWNASVQGLTNAGKAFKEHPVKALGAAASLFILGAIIAMIGGDDDDDDNRNSYYNLPEHTRRSNILFRAGDYWISIPLPVEYRAVYGMGELMTSVLSGREALSDGELASAIAGQVTQILPIDILEGQGGVRAFIPSAVKPWADVIANQSWTGLPIYKDNDFNKEMPEWTKAYKSANKHLVDLSKALNEASGGDKYTKGSFDINPAKVEYLLNGYFGGVFSTVDKMVKTGETLAGTREFDPRSVLLLNRVVKTGDERTEYRALRNEFFRLKKEHDITGKRLRNYERDTNEGIFDYAEKIDFLYQSPEYERWEIFEEYKDELKALDDNLKSEIPGSEEYKELEGYYIGLMKDMVNRMKRK